MTLGIKTATIIIEADLDYTYKDIASARQFLVALTEKKNHETSSHPRHSSQTELPH